MNSAEIGAFQKREGAVAAEWSSTSWSTPANGRRAMETLRRTSHFCFRRVFRERTEGGRKEGQVEIKKQEYGFYSGWVIVSTPGQCAAGERQKHKSTQKHTHLSLSPSGALFLPSDFSCSILITLSCFLLSHRPSFSLTTSSASSLDPCRPWTSFNSDDTLSILCIDFYLRRVTCGLHPFLAYFTAYIRHIFTAPCF